jgi:hypothetical protein
MWYLAVLVAKSRRGQLAQHKILREAMAKLA